jgi:HD-GYP domain-containing protein (c-di-GMP phosphodiesterase class II)
MAALVARGLLTLPRVMNESFAGHCEVAQRLAARLGLAESLIVCLGQLYERWDGKGYPDGIAGEQIPLLARIVSCCDAFNAMTSDRSYRQAMPQHEAVAELRRGRGTQFDPRVVDALIETLSV